MTTATSDLTRAPELRSPGLLHRLATYFQVMFPLHVYGPVAVLTFFSFTFAAQAIQPGGGVRIRPEGMFGLGSMLLVLLLMRLFDEMKDAKVDRLYFPDRPLVTGAVKYGDVKLLSIAAMLALAALNVNRGPATTMMLLLYVWLVLSWQWWFFPGAVGRSFFLVFMTTATLIPFLLAYLYAVHLRASGGALQPWRASLLVLAYWVPFFAWEVARKIRAPEDETAYPTYSRLWGPRRAAAVLMALLLVGGGATCCLVLTCGLPRVLAAYHGALLACSLVPVAAFLLRPGRRTAKLRQVVVLYTFFFHAGTIVELLRTRGAW